MKQDPWIYFNEWLNLVDAINEKLVILILSKDVRIDYSLKNQYFSVYVDRRYLFHLAGNGQAVYTVTPYADSTTLTSDVNEVITLISDCINREMLRRDEDV